MKKRNFSAALPAVLSMAALLAACGAASTSTSLLDQTRRDYMAAQSNPAVATDAAQEFRQASVALEQANAAAARREAPAKLDKLAALAQQKIAIAQATAKQKTAAHLANAGKQGDQLRLDAPAQQASQARAAGLEAQLADLAARKTERGMLITLGEVLFDANQAGLTPDGLAAVRKLADVLNSNPQRTVLIEGYTDSSDDSAHNLALSQRRAEAARNALLDLNVRRDRIATNGYGAAFPVASNDSAASRQLNRRVEIVLSEEGAAIPARR